ncbi:MAG TPA: SDR family oxidoreductase, partial [Actinocrinis sp.]|nr:SDR family oxidoreductase [Actinocrinis sp.]
ALKRLSDALRDGDTVHAVIRGSALNNDGALKAGYTAPSVAGQSRVIAAALADARVAADQVGYIEAHGTATELGDPIEVAALNRAFGPGLAPESCAIGSVKTNIGHLNHAAGAAGLIKTALTVREGLIPATLHYTSPNPEIDFTAGPFRVNTRLSPWSPPDGRARIAGLNALGLGGTNVHVVVEQAPQRPAAQHHDAGHARRFHVLPVSARTQQAAEQAVRQLGGHLAESGPDTRLADVAYTLQVGRKTFEHRRAAVARTREEAIRVLTGAKGSVPPAARVEGAHGRPVALLLAGVGEQYPGLVGELYRREPAFRAELDACLHRLADLLPAAEAADLLAGERSGAGDGGALAALLGRARTPDDARDGALERTELAQPLMFAVDYALARTLIAWGLRPAALLGYSLGEYVAAALSGVLSLDEALRLVVRRAQLIAALPGGAMAAVPLDPDELHGRFRLAERGLDIAAVNGPGTAVVAGPRDAVDRLAGDLARHAIPLRRLRATHAFHSRMLEPAADELAAWIGANTHPGAPAIPYLSNVTGDWASAPQVADARYWARHMTGTVRFADGVARLLEDPELALVEIGPGPSLGAMARAQCPPPRYPLITATLPGREDPRPADEVLTECLARLWLTGVELDWAAYHRRGGESQGSDLPGRVPLPGYPFQRQRYWIESAWQPSNPPAAAAAAAASAAQPAHETRPTGVAGFEQVDRELPRLPEDQWVYQPVWRQTAAPAAAGRQPASWLVFARGERAEAILARLRDAASAEGATVHAVRPGPRFAADEADGFEVRPGSLEDTRLMLRELRARAVPLERVVHLWTLDTPETGPEDGGDDADPKGSDPAVRLGLHCLTALARAAGELGRRDWSLDIVAAGAHAVMGGGEAVPEAATLIGPTLVIPLEYPSVATGLVDVEPGTEPAAVLAELRRPRTDQFVALRAGRRWVRGHDRIPPVRPEDGAALLREGGVYLLTGGLGGIALGMAEHLARDVHARLVLFGRTGLPPRTRWAPIAAGAEQADEGTRSRISRVLALEELGAQVEIVVGDVADPADLRRAVDTACERFGALHGVLHTAGVAGTGLIQFKHAQDCERVLAPKLAGTRALHEALRIGRADEVWLDFLVLFSSLTSATGGGPGQVDYCAANAYLDGYAASLSATGRRVLAVDWGEWTWNAWSFGLDGYDERLREFFRGHRARFGITFAEGWRSLLRALASGEPQVAVSTQDLPAMVLLAPAFNVESVAAPPPAPGRATVHPRPELLTPYREPADDAEHRVAEVWAAMLELERVGVQDNFFELGGSSLLGISLLAGLRAAFPQADLPPHILYEAPTVAALARLVRAPDPDACDRPAPGVRADAGELRRSGLKTAAARRRRS